MKNNIKRTLRICAFLGYASACFASGTMESIVFIGDDLQTGIQYKNVRYDYPGKYTFDIGNSFNKNNISYAKPDNYQWIKAKENGQLHDELVFNDTTNYAFLERIGLAKTCHLEKVKNQDNQYYMEVYGPVCMGTGCIQDENISFLLS